MSSISLFLSFTHKYHVPIDRKSTPEGSRWHLPSSAHPRWHGNCQKRKWVFDKCNMKSIGYFVSQPRPLLPCDEIFLSFFHSPLFSSLSLSFSILIRKILSTFLCINRISIEMHIVMIVHQLSVRVCEGVWECVRVCLGVWFGQRNVSLSSWSEVEMTWRYLIGQIRY